MDHSITEVADKLANLPAFIAYCENTAESEWQVNTVRNVGNTKNCVFGHLINWFYGKDYTGDVSLAWDLFEEMWTTDFEFYEINDGRDARYSQPTPRQRSIAHLKNLWLAIEPPTWRQMELV